MPASAIQSAPQARKAAAPSGEPQKKEPEKKGVMEKLRALPFAAGVALMALLLALSLPVGNLRALQNATPAPFARRPGVASILEDRAAQAGNAVTAARAAGASDALTAPVEAAAAALLEAKSAREISRADQALTSAVADLTAGAQAQGESAAMLRRAADNFAEQGSFLRQEARAYDAQIQKAVRLYERLPLRALLPAPDVYEGV